MNNYKKFVQSKNSKQTKLNWLRIYQAWMNEKFSPEILIHRSDLVDCVLEELNKIETDVQRSGKKTFESCLKQMEVSFCLKILKR